MAGVLNGQKLAHHVELDRSDDASNDDDVALRRT